MKKVVVTGSASGIGFYTASKLNESGYDVIGIDLVKNLDLDKSITQIECDLLDSERTESVFGSIGGFDIAVNCAGVSGQRKGLTEFSKQKFEQSFSAVFFPTFNAMQQELRLMEKNKTLSGDKKKIINITSYTAHVGGRNMAAYSSAKAALINLTKVAAVEHSATVRVNSISPATIDTPMIRKKYPSGWPDYSEAYLSGDCGKVEDLFAAIDMMIHNNFMTGHDLVLDGGHSADFSLKLKPV